MMTTIVVGISHKTAAIEAREKVFLRPLEREMVLSRLKNNPLVVEALVLSTCNRTEVYASVLSGEQAKDQIIDILFMIKKLPVTHSLRASFYSYSDEACVRHLLRVITGLESIVLGERQILGQIKEAVDLSRAKEMFSKQFNILTDIAIRAGKKAQNETDISFGGGSVSWAAVKTAEHALESLAGRSVLIIGAGKMSALTAEQLKNKKLGKLYIMNRTKENAVALADKLGGEAVSFTQLADVLNRVDLCICSASASHYLVGLELVEKVMRDRDHRQLICVDISTPRNVDPKVADIKNVVLFAIDDLDKVVKDNLGKRKAAVDQVEKIIDKKISEYYGKLSAIKAVEVTALIKALS